MDCIIAQNLSLTHKVNRKATVLNRKLPYTPLLYRIDSAGQFLRIFYLNFSDARFNMSMILNSMVSICKNGGGQIHPCLCRTLSTNANKGCALKRCLSNSSFRLVSNVNKNISFKQKAVGFTSMSDRVTLHPFAPFWRSNQLCRTEQTFLEHCRHFRTTKVNHMIPIGPAIWAVVKPLAKVASIVAGR